MPMEIKNHLSLKEMIWFPLRKAFILVTGDGDKILVTIWKKSTLVVNTNLKAHISLIKYKQLFQFIQAKIRNVLELFAIEHTDKDFD